MAVHILNTLGSVFRAQTEQVRHWGAFRPPTPLRGRAVPCTPSPFPGFSRVLTSRGFGGGTPPMQYDEAMRLKRFCDTSSNDFNVLADCVGARRLVRAPPGVMAALEKTLEIVLNDFTSSAYLKTREMVFTFGIGGLVIIASLVVLVLLIESRFNKWWMRRQLLTQYKQFSMAANNRQQYSISMPAASAFRAIEQAGHLD